MQLMIVALKDLKPLLELGLQRGKEVNVKKMVVILLAMFFIVMFFFILQKTRKQFKRMKTLDTMGQISVAVDKTLDIKSFDNYDPMEETIKIFPSIVLINGQICDAWGSPIKVSIKKVEGGFQVSFISLGSDKILGTQDDIIQKRYFSSNSNIDNSSPAPLPAPSDKAK